MPNSLQPWNDFQPEKGPQVERRFVRSESLSTQLRKAQLSDMLIL